LNFLTQLAASPRFRSPFSRCLKPPRDVVPRACAEDLPMLAVS